MRPVLSKIQRIPRMTLALMFGFCCGVASLLLSLPGGNDLWAGDPRVEITGPGTASVQGDVVRVQAEAGGRFVVVVPSNPTTGYRWRFAGGDPSVCSIEGSRYEGSEAGRVGAGGYEFWTFRATGPGRTQGELAYVRPWEKDQAPARTIRLDVEVR